MNVALGKPAYLSPSNTDMYVASHGNDGNTATYFYTDYGKGPWWAVDFGQNNSKVVTRVRITPKYKIGKYAN